MQVEFSIVKAKKAKIKALKKPNYDSVYWGLAIGLFYLIIALFFTYPLINNFSTSIIGDSSFTDGPFFLWNLWWVQKASIFHTNPFISDFIYYPSKTNLTLHTLTFTRSLIALPLNNFFSLIQANNILQIGSLVFSGLGTYYLACYFSQDRIAGIISGLIFAFSPFVASHLLAGHINLANLALIPFAILFFFKMIREKSWINPFVASFLLVGICFDDLQIGFYVGIMLIVVGLFEIIVNYKIFKTKEKIAQIAVFVAIFLIYFLAPYLFLVKDFWSNETLGATYNNGDLRSYIMANPLNPFSPKSGLIFTKGLIGGYRENTLSLGFLAPILAAMSFLFARKNLKEKILFFILAIVFIVLSTGPHLQIDGHIYATKLPFYYLQNLKMFSIGVVPTRFILMVYLSIAILVGLFFSGLGTFLWSKKRKWLIVLFYFFLVSSTIKIGFEYYSGQMMLTKLEPTSNLLKIIKEDPGQSNVITSLCGVRGTYYQTKFDKKVISGALGRRVHEFYMLKYRNYPGVHFLTTYDNQYIYVADPRDNDKAMLFESLRILDVKYIVLCKDSEQSDKLHDIRIWIDQMGIRAYKEDGSIILYKIK